VAEHEGEVIGFCLGYPARNLPMFRPAHYGYLSDLTVGEAWRGRGVGRALLEAAKDWFRRRDIARIHLQVYARNAPGMAFWRKAGFEEFVQGMRNSAES
jgi:GNAT superfamily N-acetyltransferase